MENRVMSTSNKTPEEIEQEMLETRESITEKVAALENQIVGTVQTAADTVNGTVEAVKSLVTHAPEAVSDSIKQAASTVKEVMKDTFNVSEHVERHPWASVGAAALLGCITGWLVSRPSVTTTLSGTAAPAPVASPPAYHPPGFLDKLVEMLGERVKELAETTVNSVSTSLKGTIQETVPTLIDKAASHLTEPSPEPAYPPTSGRRFGSESAPYTG